jgi:hypothetical protein
MPDEPGAMVKCAECGFLTLRNDFTGQLDEVDTTFRLSGEAPKRRRPDSPSRQPDGAPAIFDTPYLQMPICFVRSWNLFQEFGLGPDLGYAEVAPDLVLEVITKPRECANSESRLGFVKWEQGLTPKEHREMLDRQWRLDYEQRVRQAIDAREDARDVAMNAREDARDQTAETRHGENLRILKSQHRWQLFWFGVAVVIATVIGSMIQAGWVGKPW